MANTYTHTYLHTYTNTYLSKIQQPVIRQSDIKEVTIAQCTNTIKARQITTHNNSDLYNNMHFKKSYQNHNTISNILNANGS